MHESLTIALLQARETAMIPFRPILKRYQLTEQQWRIIRILAEVTTLDFNVLAQRACILPPSLTGILTRLERDGLVTRLRPLNDQRRLVAALTAEGMARYQQASVEIDAEYLQIARRFGADRLRQLQQLLAEFNQLPS